MLLNQNELDQFERVEITRESFMVIDPMSIELNPWPSNRRHHQEIATRSQHTRKFANGFDVTVGIERIAITAETDMLQNMHA